METTIDSVYNISVTPRDGEIYIYIIPIARGIAGKVSKAIKREIDKFIGHEVKTLSYKNDGDLSCSLSIYVSVKIQYEQEIFNLVMKALEPIRKDPLWLYGD